MNLTRRSLLGLAGLGAAAGLSACELRQLVGDDREGEEAPGEQERQEEEPAIDLAEFEGLAIDMDAWSYDAANDCYYQLGLPYCNTPSSEQYETLAIFVPGAYFTATKRGSTYRCAVDPTAKVGDFTAETAPVALPINSSYWSAQPCPTSYSYDGLGRFLEAGVVYVYAGFRGRSGGYESTTQEFFSGGAPWAVADLKAAVRCLRYNAAVLPCDTSRVFAFGLGAGGTYSVQLGVSGNAEAFDPYLKELGAATHDLEGAELTDEIMGSASWCPAVSLDAGDAAYEWMMGQYAHEDSRVEGSWTALLSQDLTDAYGDYLNSLSLADSDGNPLTLDRIEDGSFGGGTYYDRLLKEVRDSASAFLASTTFPYTSMPPVGVAPYFPGDADLSVSEVAESSQEGNDESAASEGVRQVQATVYDSLESYVAASNGEDRWLTYNASRGEADITGLWGFVNACRPATRGVCAYDALDRSGTANQLFGTDEQSSLHFDAMVGSLLQENHERYGEADGWDEGLVAAWSDDLAQTDALDVTVADRVTMCSPLSYLCGEQPLEATVAPHWRIMTGLFQAETSLTSEVALACALEGSDAVEDVAFEAVWEAGYGLAERSGDAQDNLVAWMVASCPDASQDGDSSQDS